MIGSLQIKGGQLSCVSSSYRFDDCEINQASVQVYVAQIACRGAIDVKAPDLTHQEFQKCSKTARFSMIIGSTASSGFAYTLPDLRRQWREDTPTAQARNASIEWYRLLLKSGVIPKIVDLRR